MPLPTGLLSFHCLLFPAYTELQEDSQRERCLSSPTGSTSVVSQTHLQALWFLTECFHVATLTPMSSLYSHVGQGPSIVHTHYHSPCLSSFVWKRSQIPREYRSYTNSAQPTHFQVDSLMFFEELPEKSS